ncbi:uncharacterized protein VTP21DRAFT_4096 [Calcarisporiella thermophila]|uniref:uncharacterized protein n=1 Tax=Calcarisporiella thermophila TaxID=911321 RepID=UPI003744A329
MANIGPQIPEHLLRKSEDSPEEAAQEEEDVGIGPALPPGFLKPSSENESKPFGTQDEEQSDEAAFCPELPPDLIEERKSKTDRKVYGPAVPPPLNEDRAYIANAAEDDDDIIGPKPPPSEANLEKDDMETRIAEFEERAARMKQKLERPDKFSEEDSKPKRGEWMTMAPEKKVSGIPVAGQPMRARQFAKTSTEAELSQEWFETPKEREQRLRENPQSGSKRKEPEPEPQLSRRDLEYARQIEEYNLQNRSRSLMDMHRDQRAKSQKEEEPASRGWDRERDINVPRKVVDSRTRRAMVQKSVTDLSSRFGHGKRGAFS